GFGNNFASEALPGVLPVGQNSPQHVKYGLYAEQLTGTSFVETPRAKNRRTWMYRIRPAVVHQGFKKLPTNPDLEANFSTLNPKVYVSPTQLAWRPFPIPDSTGEKRVDFVDGLKTIATVHSDTFMCGHATKLYSNMFNCSMGERAFVSTDGHLLIVPQLGTLIVQTELGKMSVPNGMICVVPRGIRFKVLLSEGTTTGRGYIFESFGSGFELPELGPLGHSGLALERDFEYPIASFEGRSDYGQKEWEIVYKVQGELHSCRQSHTPFDVVAWHGNYAPFRYDLSRFVNVGSISVDHIDPSIFCVLTCPSASGGKPLADFLIFSPRWDVANHTYRPPYYHRNCASEVMGLIRGAYGGRSDGFQPGGQFVYLSSSFCCTLGLDSHYKKFNVCRTDFKNDFNTKIRSHISKLISLQK
ncbi:uncharacterized protein MELLADRAFT_36325, partial [Melampsora larici-populina 98AG31]